MPGANGQQWMTIQIPLAAGLVQKVDTRAVQPPGLTICRDVQFDEAGGLQTRPPFSGVSTDPLTNVRTVVGDGDELLVFTKDTLFTYDEGRDKYRSRGTHLAVKVTEETRFATTGDQVDTDRAKLSGTCMFVWTEGSNISFTMRDELTGATILAQTTVAGTRPRLVPLSTRVLLIWRDGSGNLVAQAINPATDPATTAASLSSPTTILAAASFNLFYDAVVIAGTDTAIVGCRRAVTTSYELLKVTSALAVTAATKARTCDGPIAVASDPTGATIQVIRGNGTNVQGDRITASSLADAATGQAIGTASGTPINQIAAAHRSVQNSGQYRCYAFWSAEETSGSLGFALKTNFVDTGGTIGTQGTLRLRLGVASRAFDHDGNVYVWGVFAGQSGTAGMGEPLGFRAQLQNTYVLYRDDGHWAAKAAFDIAGGFAPSTGRLPGVQLTSGSTGYSWCGTERRIIPLGGDHSGYSDRGPRDIFFQFDSNEARRAAKLGNTLYLSGGIVLQYDGVALNEVGFTIYPWLFATATVGGGAIPAGQYAIKNTMRWDNARYERERSTTATGELATSAGAQKFALSIASLHVTRKTGIPPTIEVWRTLVSPGEDAAFYKATGEDPAVVAGDNCYIVNPDTAGSPSTWQDNFTDAVLSTKETFPEVGAVLENLAPPAASIILASDTRLFLAGVAGEPNRIWYSKIRRQGEIASFHDTLVIEVPRAGGPITALRFSGETLVAFCETATYALPGDGLDNVGSGVNYGPAREVSLDVGAISQEATASVPGGIVFKSRKGWYRLTNTPEYIGANVIDFDSDTILGVQVIESKHQVRFLSATRMLMFDYVVNEWSEWTITDGLASSMWHNQHVYATASGVKIEQSDLEAGVNYGMDVQLAPIKLASLTNENGLQGAGRVRRVMLLGEHRSTHSVLLRLGRDYRADFFDEKAMPSLVGAVAGDPLQFRHSPTQGRCEALTVRITAIESTTQAFAVTDAPQLQDPNGMWAATLSALQRRAKGAAGNGLQLTIALIAVGGAEPVSRVEVRDNQTHDGTSWSLLWGNVGVLAVGTDYDGSDPIEIGTIEAAITATSEILRVSTPHISSTAKVDMAVEAGSVYTFVLADGVDADPDNPPNGEAFKLTGIALEVAVQPGLHRRLSAAQKQ